MVQMRLSEQLRRDARYGDPNIVARLLLDDARRGIFYPIDVCRPVIRYPTRYSHDITTCIRRDGTLGPRIYLREARLVCSTVFFNGDHLSTVYIPIDMSFEKTALIFETMLFGSLDELCYRYSNEDDARKGHRRIEKEISAMHAQYVMGLIRNLDDCYLNGEA